MEKISEDFELTIKELSKTNEVKDLGFGINTSQSGKAEFVTPHINGLIEGIYIDSVKQVSIKIWIAGWPDDVLYDDVSFVGQKYLPLRLNAIDSKGERFNFSPVQWALNNSLVVRVEGGFNSQVNFVVRYI